MTALLRVEEGASAHVALEGVFAQATLEARDRGLVTELVDGTLRWQGRLDYQLQQVLDRPLEQLPLAIRLVLRLGAYQLTLLERVPAHAAVNESVSLAHQYGHEGTAELVNAVLRRLEREHATLTFPNPDSDPVAYLSSAYSHPAWLVERWLPRFGFAETEALLKIDNTPAAGDAARESALDHPRRLAAFPGHAWPGDRAHRHLPQWPARSLRRQPARDG